MTSRLTMNSFTTKGTEFVHKERKGCGLTFRLTMNTFTTKSTEFVHKEHKGCGLASRLTIIILSKKTLCSLCNPSCSLW